MYPPRMSTDTLDHAALLLRFQAVAEETRFRIMQILSEGERCVCDLQVPLGAAQSRLSFHLRKLKEAGLVDDRREGRWVYYSLRPEALEEMRAFLGEVTTGEVRYRPATGLPVCRPAAVGGEGEGGCCG